VSFLAAAFAVAGLAAVAFWPAFSAHFIGDDWGYLALARHIDSPLSFYTYDHSASYFYRPNTMVLWWASVATLALDATAQYALNFALHVGNALLLGVIVFQLSGRRGIAIAAATVFAVHPVGIGASLWLSDRFDLLATLGVLGAIICLERAIAGRGGRFALLACATLAAGAKETAIVLPLAVLLRLLAERNLAWSWRLTTLIVVAAPFGLFLGVRAHLINDVSLTLDETDLLAAAGTGIGAWLARTPEVFVGTRWKTIDAALLGLGTLWAILAVARGIAGQGLRPARESPEPFADNAAKDSARRIAALAALGLGCVIGPALVQWPVTKGVLVDPQALVNPANLRFYYLALAGLCMLFAAAFMGMRNRRARVAAALAAALACIGWIPAARVHAHYWTEVSNGPDHRVEAAAGRLAATLSVAPRCRIYLLPADLPSGFARFADAVVKAQVPRDSPLLACAVTTALSPWYTITREQPCSNDGWEPLVPLVKQGETVRARPIGGLCYHYFVDPPSRENWRDPATRWFELRGDSFVELNSLAIGK